MLEYYVIWLIINECINQIGTHTGVALSYFTPIYFDIFVHLVTLLLVNVYFQMK